MARTWAGLHCSSSAERTEFLSRTWSSLKESSRFASHPVRAGLLRQPEDALADHVLLDLRGAGVDGAGARPQIGVRPAPALADGRVDVESEVLRRAFGQLAVGTQDLQGQLHEALLELRVRELGDGAARPRMLPALELGQRAQGLVALHLDLRPDASELLAHHGILEKGLAVATQSTRRFHQPVELRGLRGDAREGAA